MFPTAPLLAIWIASAEVAEATAGSPAIDQRRKPVTLSAPVSSPEPEMMIAGAEVPAVTMMDPDSPLPAPMRATRVEMVRFSA